MLSMYKKTKLVIVLKSVKKLKKVIKNIQNLESKLNYLIR